MCFVLLFVFKKFPIFSSKILWDVFSGLDPVVSRGIHTIIQRTSFCYPFLRDVQYDLLHILY